MVITNVLAEGGLGDGDLEAPLSQGLIEFGEAFDGKDFGG